jgi:pimeloyl-ACP methyl ester carboxylesterase
MTSSFVAVPGGRLFVVDEGRPQDPAIHLLHAGIANLRSWDALAPRLVEAGYRVIRHDTRGFGRTETADVDFSERADVLAVLDHLGIGRAALVGNSLGGSIAFDTAIESPDRVVAVVGVGAGLRGFEVDSTPDEEARFLEMEAVEETMDAATDDDAKAAALETLLEMEMRFWLDGPAAPDGRVAPEVRAALMEMDRDHLRPGRVLGRPIRLQPAANARLGDLRAPVLAVAGDLDVSDVATTARHLEAAAPDARAVILPGVAHMIGMEAPEVLADLILTFLAPIPRWS